MGEDTDPPPLYKARAFGSHDNAPPPSLVTKNPATALLTLLIENLQRPSSLRKS